MNQTIGVSSDTNYKRWGVTDQTPSVKAILTVCDEPLNTGNKSFQSFFYDELSDETELDYISSRGVYAFAQKRKLSKLRSLNLDLFLISEKKFIWDLKKVYLCLNSDIIDGLLFNNKYFEEKYFTEAYVSEEEDPTFEDDDFILSAKPKEEFSINLRVESIQINPKPADLDLL